MATEPSELRSAARTLVWGAGGLVVAFLLLRPLAPYVSVVASGLLLAVAFWALGGVLVKRARLPYPVAVVIVMLIIVLLLSALVAWMGPLLSEQLSELQEAVRRGIENARAWFESTPTGRSVLSQAQEAVSSMGGGGDVIGVAGGVASGVRTGLEVLTGAAVAILLGVFIAMNPSRYVDGALLLVPREHRARTREVIRTAVCTLRSWLAARLILMIVIGTAFGIALAALGVPLALPLGVLTGALAFIPYLGALLSVLPALAVAFTEGPEKALQVLVAYLVIQSVETYLLDPLVEARAVRLAPALVLLAQLVAVVWFGPVAVLYATPLLVVMVVAVRMLYVEDQLGEPAPEPAPEPPKKKRFRWPAYLRPRQRA